MCLSDCQKCKYLDRTPHHQSDIICSLNPAYAAAWKRLNSLDEYSLKCLPIDECRDFELDSAFEEKAIALSLSFSSWQTLARESQNPSIIEALKAISFQLELSLTAEQWQAMRSARALPIANSSSDPYVRVALESQGISPHRDNWIHVDSSCIDAVAYSQPESILKIRFNSGQIYEYNNVPHNVFFSLLDADSKGHFFNRYIKDIYSYR